MIAWMLYCIVVGALLAVAARAAEWVAGVARVPVRWCWAAAIATTLALGVVAPYRRTLSGALPNATTGATMLPQDLPLGAGIAAVNRQLPSSANLFAAIAWMSASAVLVALMLGVHARIRRARRVWPIVDLHGVRVRVSPRVGPVVIGVSRPEIVVPRWLLERDAEEQRLVVAHEAEHLAAKDSLLLGAACAAAALMPWNPAVWLMFSRLRLAVELDCDARVLRRGVAVRSYGALLIDVAARATPLEFGAPAFTKGPSHLQQRIVAMKRSVPRFARLRGAFVALLGAGALLAACEAKMPTSAEIDAMDVGAMEKSAGALGVAPQKAAYIVDGKRVTRAEAIALKPQDIASVELAKVGGEDLVEVHTGAMKRKPYTALSAGGDPITVAGELVPRPQSGAEPLIIIDGVRSTSAALKALDRNSITNIDVIKGVAAEREFGADAARGVVRVLTKAGAKR